MAPMCDPTVTAQPWPPVAASRRFATLCSFSPVFAAEAASEGEDRSGGGCRAVPMLAARSPSTFPFCSHRSWEEMYLGKDRFWGQEALSSTEAGRKQRVFHQTSPSLGSGQGLGCPAQEEKAMSTMSLVRAGDSSSIFYVVPLYNSLTCIFTIKCPSPCIS